MAGAEDAVAMGRSTTGRIVSRANEDAGPKACVVGAAAGG